MRLGRFTEISALGTEPDESPVLWLAENMLRKFEMNLRCRAVGNLVGDNIDTLVPGNRLRCCQDCYNSLESNILTITAFCVPKSRPTTLMVAVAQLGFFMVMVGSIVDVASLRPPER